MIGAIQGNRTTNSLHIRSFAFFCWDVGANVINHRNHRV